MIREPDGKKSMRIAMLYEEIDAILYANSLYWEQREGVTHEGRIEYQSRIERLGAIRSELTQLQSACLFGCSGVVHG
jgi:hypothetical protein